MNKSICGASLVCLLVLGSAACMGEDKEPAQEVKIELSKLPQAVVDAVKAAQPGGTMVEADIEKKGATTVYEVDVKNNGKSFEVTVDETGKVLSNKEEKEEANEKKK